MKLFAVALLALATASTAFAEFSTVEEDDTVLQIPTESEFRQTIVLASSDHLYQYTVLVHGPSDRETVKEFVSGTVQYGRRLSGVIAAEEIETFVNLDRLVTLKCTVIMAAELRNLDFVASVVMDLGMYASVDYNWGNDRSDQDALPLTSTYSPLATGKGQRVYIIDTGVTINHEEFAYGARAEHGWNFVDDKEDSTDGHSHGTHCAGTAVGASTGMAPDATVIGVRVMNDGGAGSSTNVIRGVEWATANALAHGVVGVLSLSLGGPADDGMDNAVSAASAKGMIPVVAAGNAGSDACNISPARSTGSITVGAYDQYDSVAYFSNWGTCVDIFAPGVKIISASNTGPGNFMKKSGTSMSAPHVAGAIAVFLELNGGMADLDSMRAMLESAGGKGILKGNMNTSPNLMLRVPAQGESFSGIATNAPSHTPTKVPTTTPSTSPTMPDAVLMVDQVKKNFKPSIIGPVFDPSRALNAYIVVADESNHNGCAHFTDDFTGHVVLIKRGVCDFYTKISHAQTRGAAGVIVYDSHAGELTAMGHTGGTSDISITSFFISLEDGEAIQRDIEAGKPGHVFVGHPHLYTAPGAGRPDFDATEAPTRTVVTPTPTKRPSKRPTKRPTKLPTKSTASPTISEPEAEPCETYRWFSHCMNTDEQRWTKCNWDMGTSKCLMRTAMPCSQHRLWKSCNIHGDVCHFTTVNGVRGCRERPVDQRKPLPIENGPQCSNHDNDEAACRLIYDSCFWISSPSSQRGCFSRGGGGILEAGGPVDEPYTPETCNSGTYWQAHNYCETNDMRLCSAHELAQDNGTTTNLSKQEANCDVAKKYVWTNTRCGVSTGSSVLTYHEETDTTKCQTAPSSGSRAGFRCCQDIPNDEKF